MAAALNNVAVFHHKDQIGILDGGQPVCDDKGRAVFHTPFHFTAFPVLMNQRDPSVQVFNDDLLRTVRFLAVQ